MSDFVATIVRRTGLHPVLRVLDASIPIDSTHPTATRCLPERLFNAFERSRIHTGRQVADVLAGQYVSVFKGRGIEFDEVRPYVPGDDVRIIDWNVTARAGMPYVKRFVEERQLTLMLMADVSPPPRTSARARVPSGKRLPNCAPCWPSRPPTTTTRSG